MSQTALKDSAGTAGESPSLDEASGVFAGRLPVALRGSAPREAMMDFRRQELDAEFARRRPLRDWIVITGLSVALSLVVSGRGLLGALLGDHTGISQCIAVVFLISLGKSLADAMFLDREFRRTDEQIRLLWKANNVRAFLDRAKPSLFRHHVANLATIFRRDDQIEQDNLVELMHARLRARVRPVEVAASVLVSVGLVGTIVGLIGSVGGLGRAMQSAGGDQGGLMNGMNEALGGMGIAFSATLMGSIFGGVILRLTYTSVNGQVEHFVAHVAELAEVHILPVLRDAARERRASETERRSRERDGGRSGSATSNATSGRTFLPAASSALPADNRLIAERRADDALA